MPTTTYEIATLAGTMTVTEVPCTIDTVTGEKLFATSVVKVLQEAAIAHGPLRTNVAYPDLIAPTKQSVDTLALEVLRCAALLAGDEQTYELEAEIDELRTAATAWLKARQQLKETMKMSYDANEPPRSSIG